jgi:hypothetical protein
MINFVVIRIKTLTAACKTQVAEINRTAAGITGFFGTRRTNIAGIAFVQVQGFAANGALIIVLHNRM